MRTRPAREIGAGPRESLQDRSHRDRSGQPLDEFIRNVAGVERWNHQDIGVSAHRTAVDADLPARHLWDERRIGLELAVDREVLPAVPEEFDRMAHALDRLPS